MYGDKASTNRRRCRSVNSPMGERRPTSAYFALTGTERREEISFANRPRRKPNGPIGIMSGSKNKFSRNGSTACSESGPPSWNSTMPTRFFPANLAAPMLRILQPLDFRLQRRGPPRYGQVVHEENSPPDQVRRKQTVEVLHAAS